ncbi:MAG: prolipoprotein diacylglyceryl transferase, partial [Alphaproteobacteria bacterium]|nr:prolipoprotein diacylglyceryl transferase [Alphaproteobacteria bacterium]
MPFLLAFPTIDPVLIHIGPLPIRWYSLAYIAGLLLGWAYARALVQR